MPKSKHAVILGDGTDGLTLPPVESARVAADAIYRAALDTWHHHERMARLVGRPTVDSEHRYAREMCRLCDAALTEMVGCYASAAATLHPEAADDAWWHRANGLWHAAREYLRRHGGCDRLTARAGAHSPEQLGALVVEFDLEASSVLALKHAADAYKRVRPE